MMDRWSWMVPRFCAYGFLKNFRFFDAFLILFLRQKGLSFLEIGTLIGVRELTVVVLEIPTGLVADMFGRRRAMICSFGCYIVSFVGYWWGGSFLWLLPAVALFGVGDALRSGTHKAMILEYLDVRGLSGQSVAVYGRTRSWSQVGSGVCALLGAALVFWRGEYAIVFLASIVPYLLGMALVGTYPRELDGRACGGLSLAEMLRFAGRSFEGCLRTAPLRGVLINSALDKGIYKVAKDYLQPILESVAGMLLPLVVVLSPQAGERQATAVAVGAAYFAIHLGSAAASRRAAGVQRRLGGPKRALNRTYAALVLVCVLAFVALKLDLRYLAVLAFVLFAAVENTRRPMLVSYVGAFADRDQRATVLSVEAQMHALVAMGLGPLMGWWADRVGIAGVFVVAIALFCVLGIPLRIREEAHNADGGPARRVGG